MDLDLCTASALGYLEEVKEILKSSCYNINDKDNEGWAAIMYACYYEHKSVVEQLMFAGAYLDVINNKGQTMLMMAASNGNLDLLKLVYQKNLLECQDINGYTALLYAVNYGQLQTAKYLLSQKTNVNTKENEGLTSLMLASMSGNGAMVDLLLGYGAKKHLVCNNGKTAEEYATKNGYSNIAQALRTIKVITDLKELLEHIGQEKYWPVFEKQNVDLKTFLTFTEDDLKSAGILLFGPRRKMSIAIAHFRSS
uniref:SAM domain-containing protein n=2 Tax=Clastoptera arizonana TaxID=38151 RepID=A0A1B6CHS1_9HEMI